MSSLSPTGPAQLPNICLFKACQFRYISNLNENFPFESEKWIEPHAAYFFIWKSYFMHAMQNSFDKFFHLAGTKCGPGKIIELCSLSLQIFYYKTVSGVGLFGVCVFTHAWIKSKPNEDRHSIRHVSVCSTRHYYYHRIPGRSNGMANSGKACE